MTTKQGNTPTAADATPASEAPGPITINGRRAVAVPLQEPIKRAGGDVSALHLMRPGVGDLRGLSLSELLMCQADTVAKLLPRISVPTLAPHEVQALDPADFVACSAEVVDFLTPQAARATAGA